MLRIVLRVFDKFFEYAKLFFCLVIIQRGLIILFIFESLMPCLMPSLTSTIIDFLKLLKKWKVYQKQNLSNFEKNWLQNCPSDFKPHYYRRYVDDIVVLYISPKHLKTFRNFLYGLMLTCHLQLKTKRLFVKIKHLPFLTTVNLPLVEFI